MNFWESADKLVKKKVHQLGKLCDYPSELAKCTVVVQKFGCDDLTLEYVQDQLHSKIVRSDAEKMVLIMGEACCLVDREFERAILTMSESEQSTVTIKIPLENQKVTTIDLEISLENVEPYQAIWHWSIEEKYRVALRYKEIGVKLFGAKRIVDAFYMFSKACKILITLEPIDRDNPKTKNILELRTMLYNNMAECQLNRGNFELTITLCDKVLARSPENIKALYRRGLAQGNLKNYEPAIEDLREVLNLDPKNSKAQEYYKIFHEHWKKSIKGYEKIVKKMFKSDKANE